MNEAMKLENIKAYCEETGCRLENQENVIYAQIDAKFWQYALFSGFAALSIKHVVLIFNKETIEVLGLGQSGNFTGKNFSIEKASVTDWKFKKGLIQSSFTIFVDQEKMKFKIPNVVLVAKYQKPNLTNLIEKSFLLTT